MNNYQKCCRVCLLQDEAGDFCSIIDGASEIAEEIFNIAKVKISEGRICRTCQAELEIAVQFRDKCIKSDSFLRRINEAEEIKLNDQNEARKEEPAEGSYTEREISVEIKNDNSNLITDGVAQCRLCFKTFTSMHSLKDHKRAIHEKLSEKEMFKCEHCPRLFKMKYYLSKLEKLSPNLKILTFNFQIAI